jgi:hypothetical protein
LRRGRPEFSNNFDTFISNLPLIKDYKKLNHKNGTSEQSSFSKFRTATVK